MAAAASGVSRPGEPGPRPTTNRVPRRGPFMISAYQHHREVGKVFVESRIQGEKAPRAGPPTAPDRGRPPKPPPPPERGDWSGEAPGALQPADRPAAIEDRADLTDMVRCRTDRQHL